MTDDGTTLHESGGVVQPTDAREAPEYLSRTEEKVWLDGYDTGRSSAVAVPQAPLQAEPVPVVASEPVAPNLGDSYEPTMDIYSKPGTTVRFRGAGGYEGERQAALKAGFIKNAIYTVKRCDVGRSHTDVVFDEMKGRWNSCMFADVATPQAEPAVAEQARPEKYDDTLLPFLALMRAELHANSSKGDRPGWLNMSRDVGLLEIYWHTAKLSAAVKNNDLALIREHTADVANMAMMLADVCCALPAALASQSTPPPAPDMPAICAALGFDPTNHHNAAKCPYCNPARANPTAQLNMKDPTQ